MLRFLGTIKNLAQEKNLSEQFYSHYKLDLESGIKFYNWMKRNDVPDPVEMEELHCTLIYSKTDPTNYEASNTPIDIDLSLGEFAHLGKSEDNMATVLKLPLTSALSQRYNLVKSKGATSDFPTYIPHITLSYKAFNYSHLVLPDFHITLYREFLRYS